MENMMENLMPIVQAMKGQNPQQILMKMIGNRPIQNPLIVQMINCAKTGDNATMLNLASNYFTSQGFNIDINKEFQTFMQMLK